jgi:hypothetical protein
MCRRSAEEEIDHAIRSRADDGLDIRQILSPSRQQLHDHDRLDRSDRQPLLDNTQSVGQRDLIDVRGRLRYALTHSAPTSARRMPA